MILGGQAVTVLRGRTARLMPAPALRDSASEKDEPPPILGYLEARVHFRAPLRLALVITALYAFTRYFS